VAHDRLQIALEHHRAGRLTQAEAGYRALLAEDPDHADARHWLGVLLFQAGQFDDAVTHLERAVELRPADTAFLHNLAQAYVALGRDDEAINAFEAARAAGADSADLSYALGVAQLRDRRIDDAIASLQAALAKHRDFAPTHYHLAVAYRAKNEPLEVRKALIGALEIDPNFSAAWHALGVLDREAGNDAQAEASFRKAERAARGGVATAPPRPASVADLERRLTPDESARKLHDVLADATGLIAPASLAREQVAELFDRYADGFDAHLQETLGYRVPEMIGRAVGELRPFAYRSLDILDLGCGTGLCGPPLRPMAKSLRGVDLSPAMIDKARARGAYDELSVGDLVEALKSSPPDAYDVLVAADVLNYVGDLAPTMEAAAAALRHGGLFVFSIEAAPPGEERFLLRKGIHRYAHAEGYVRHVAGIFGFEVRSFEPITVRTEGGQPVAGYLVALSR
jgi:predicted TPR repeat methyltransferase